jgi:hypothetical protein
VSGCDRRRDWIDDGFSLLKGGSKSKVCWKVHQRRLIYGVVTISAWNKQNLQHNHDHHHKHKYLGAAGS